METVGEISSTEVGNTYVFENIISPSLKEETQQANGVSDSSRVNNTEKHQTYVQYDPLQESSNPRSQHTLIHENVSTVNKEIIMENADTKEDHTLIVSEIFACNTEVEEAVENICPSQETLVSDTNGQIEEILTHNVQFETEVIVENNCSVPSDVTENSETIYTEAQDLANEMKQDIELNEVLQSSDNTDNIENNNCNASDEVLNKEELLDILEGNVDTSAELSSSQRPDDDEAILALKQLSRLKKRRKRTERQSNTSESTPSKKPEGTPSKKPKNEEVESENRDKITAVVNENVDSKIKPGHLLQEQVRRKRKEKQSNPTESTSSKKNKNDKKDSDNHNKKAAEGNVDKKSEPAQDADILPKKNNIINNIVEDWDDDIADENEAASDDKNEGVSEKTDDKSDTNLITQNIDSTKSPSTSQMSNDSPKKQNDKENSVSSSKRVIKKKVIFDPDNPDTFTKGKAPGKSKETSDKEHKEQPPPKKAKSERISRSESKSPSGKQQWKKPTPKRKLMSEVDKLLMDEGAVNMMYQMNPDAKGKKNIKSKAELIKKLQSSTPDGPTMKFRERKKESGAKQILGNNQRGSTCNSIKSEEFDNHSADDSIIYRRHSSSSYSSSCMSPRRMSDVDSIIPTIETKTITSDTVDTSTEVKQEDGDFLSESNNEEIKKSHCLSLKEKLNHKLSQVLNKSKVDSPVAVKMNSAQTKQSKFKKGKQKALQTALKVHKPCNYKLLTVKFENSLAEICIKNTGSKYYDVETLWELQSALETVEAHEEVGVTLLTAESGSLCTSLDMRPLLDANLERRTNKAYQLAEAARRVQWAVVCARSVVLAGAWGGDGAAGLSTALLALADEAYVCERDNVRLHSPNAPLLPGAVALAHQSRLSRDVVQSLCVRGSSLSAEEARRAGLVTRVLPASAVSPHDQLRGIATHLATQPKQMLVTRKRLMLAGRGGEQSALATALEAERDVMVEHWLSVHAQDVLRQLYSM